MAVYVGETVKEPVTILQSGVPATGRTFTKQIARDPDGADFAVSVSEVGSGVYEVTFLPTTAGTWFVLFAVNTTPVQYVELSVDVDPASARVAVAAAPAAGLSRKELRRQILRDLGDLVILRATANGTDVTFIDERNLFAEPGTYRGREVLFTAGTPANLGLVRYVAGSSQAARSISFTDPLPQATQAGDEAEMINTRGTGWRFDEVHEAINKAIREIGEQAATVRAGSSQPFTAGTGLTIPPEFFTVERVAWQDPDDPGRWHDLPRARRPDGHGWWYDPTEGTVKITGTPARRADGRTVRLWGAVLPAELASDSDSTAIDPAWLRAQVMANLLYARFLRMPRPETERSMAYALQRADRLRAQAISRRSPLAVRVRP